jgi:ATP-binding cassette, subfamily A (ABC1), member 3
MMMLTGGSRVCCVDEVSGGLDPLSRRHVWDILIAERGTRTVLLTTHFLDEAEYLADHIVVLSKGSLKAEGSSVELKNKLGGGYRVEVMHGPDDGPTPNTTLDGVSKVETHNETTYIVPDPAYGLRLIKLLEDEGISNYRITSPTLQEVFMKLAEEATDESDSDILPYPQEPRPEEAHRIGSHTKENALMTIASRDKEVTLQTGRPISLLRQAFVLFRKRLTITMRNSFPSVAAVCIPIIAAGILTLLLRHHQITGCSRTDQVDISDNQNLSKNINISLVIGPRSALSPENLKLFSNGFSSVINPGGSGSASLLQSIHTVDTLDEFNLYIKDNFSIVNPGGIFLGGNGESPTFAYKADGAPYSDVEGGLVSSVVMQNVLDVLLTNVSIGTQFNTFDVPWAASFNEPYMMELTNGVFREALGRYCKSCSTLGLPWQLTQRSLLCIPPLSGPGR